LGNRERNALKRKQKKEIMRQTRNAEKAEASQTTLHRKSGHRKISLEIHTNKEKKEGRAGNATQPTLARNKVVL
jgi:hypothetical protein